MNKPKPVETTEIYAWIAWNAEDNMWGIVAGGPNPNVLMSATSMKRQNAERMRPGLIGIAAMSRRPLKLVRFTFAEVIGDIPVPAFDVTNTQD